MVCRRTGTRVKETFAIIKSTAACTEFNGTAELASDEGDDGIVMVDIGEEETTGAEFTSTGTET